MAPIQKHGETCMVADGFPALLYEALERDGPVQKPEYHVFKQQMPNGVMEYWARVILFNNLRPDGRTMIFTASRTESAEQAIQAVAYKALGHVRHEHQDMAWARATRFLPQYPVDDPVRYYEDTNAEEDPAVIGLARYVEALDTLTHQALVELDKVRTRWHAAEARLERALARERAAQAPEAPVRDIPVAHEEPAPEPPRRRFCACNSRVYLRRLLAGVGPSRTNQTPAPTAQEDEEEEDPEEREPATDDEQEP